MRVFVTGATGFIGSALIPKLVAGGHQVLGLSRSEAGARSLAAAGAEVHRGDIYDLESIRSGAAKADAVIHLAFNHDFSRFQENCETDRRVIEAIGGVLAGSDGMFLITSGVATASPKAGQPATEDDPPMNSSLMPRAASEEQGAAVGARGVRVVTVRLPQVHDTRKQGLVSFAIQIARQKGVAAYVGEGRSRWAAAPLDDVAHLYHLALEKGEGNVRYNAVAEEGVAARDIAEAIGRGLKIPAVSIAPEEATAHFGVLGMFMQWDLVGSSAKTREKLGWNPTGPTLLSDLENMDYSQA
ncbi:MAG TPA: SDR family oxidoreductase [Terracidiphilus sp.]